MSEFVEEGGTWVMGPLSGFRTEDATAYKNAALGPLEDLLKIHVRHRFPPNEEGANIKWQDSKNVKCSSWCDALEVKESVKVLAKYSDGPARGMPAVVECSLGKGKVLVFGTMPENEFLGKWFKDYFKLETQELQSFSKGIIVTPRVHEKDKDKVAGIIAVDTSGKGGKIILKKNGVNLFDEKKEKEILFAPYDVKIIHF